MRELLLSPLGPALIFLVAGALLRLLAGPRRSSALALLTLVPLGLVAVLLLLARAVGMPPLQISWWPLIVPALDVVWALDGWNWLALVLLTLVGAEAILLTWRRPGRRTGAFHGLSLLLLSGATLSVVSDNLLTLSAAWVATDIILVARARGGKPQAGVAPVWLEASGSLLFLIAISITSLGVASTSLATAALPAETQLLLLLVAALRMAAYPLHLWLAPAGRPRDRGTQLLINGVGLVTGGWLLGRMFALGAGNWLHSAGWEPLLTLLVLAAGLAAWSGSRDDRFAMLASGRAAWIWLIMASAPLAMGRDALGWALLSVILGLMLLAVSQAIQEQWGWRLPLLLAAATLAGMPFTAGMPPRSLAQPSNLLLALVAVVADGLAVACVLLSWNLPASSASTTLPVATPAPTGNASRGANWPVLRLLTAFGLAMVPNLMWGIAPRSLAQSAGFGADLSFGQLAGQMGWLGLLAVVAALGLGAGFAELLRRPENRPEVWRARLARATGLSWLLEGLRWLSTMLEAGWRTVLLVVEGEAYFGWIVLLLLLAWLVLQV